MNRVDPRYPELAPAPAARGATSFFASVVETNGSVGKIEVSPGSLRARNAAVEAVGKWAYRPARVDGQPVAVWKVVRVKFTYVSSAEPAPDRVRLQTPASQRCLRSSTRPRADPNHTASSGNEISLGRSSENEIVLNDFSVSRKHAA